jgi:hypothetical protein
MHHPLLLVAFLAASFLGGIGGGAVAKSQTTATAQAGKATASAVTLPTPPADQAASETNCAAPVETSFIRRGYSRAVTTVGSPLAAIRLRFAERMLARASARHASASAAASRVSSSSRAVGPQQAHASAGVAE